MCGCGARYNAQAATTVDGGRRVSIGTPPVTPPWGLPHMYCVDGTREVSYNPETGTWDHETLSLCRPSNGIPGVWTLTEGEDTIESEGVWDGSGSITFLAEESDHISVVAGACINAE